MIFIIGYSIIKTKHNKTNLFNFVPILVAKIDLIINWCVAIIINVFWPKKSKTLLLLIFLVIKIIANAPTIELNTYRNKQAGAGSYIWQTMEDDRVRPAHQDLDGKQFDYDDPNGGDDGQLPGQPINCRCVATPVFD